MKGRCDTPRQKGYLSDTCAIPYENKANGCDTPLCDTISKGYCAIWGLSRTGPLSMRFSDATLTILAPIALDKARKWFDSLRAAISQVRPMGCLA